MNILNIIIEQKLLEISIQSVKQPIEKLKKMERDFPILDYKKLFQKNETQIITEVKQKLLSKDEIKDQKLVLDLINDYEKNGADSISVLTDHYFFGGSLNFLKFIKQNTKIPILQKDFIISEYQIFQAFIYGADGIILIAEALDYFQLKDYYDLAKKLGLEVFIEIHTIDALEKINKINPDFIVVSSRNLETMKVNIKYFEIFYSLISEKSIIIAEGGIKSDKDFKYIKNLKYNGAFVGAGLMLKENPDKILNKFVKE